MKFLEKKKWNKDEIKFLLENKNIKTHKEMAHIFKVSINSISKTIYRYTPKYKIPNNSLLKKIEIFNEKNKFNPIIFHKKHCIFTINNEIYSLISIILIINKFCKLNENK
jgi:hypothetical protein